MAKNKSGGAKGEESWGKLIRDIAVILLLVLGIHSLLAKPFYIPSDSMMPGLLSGDRLIVSKYPYGWSYASASFHLLPRMEGRIFAKLPERGDIVVLEHPVDRTDYIKRVIGLPGDTIELKGGALFINGKPVKREQQPDLRIPVDANTPSGGGGSALDRFRQVDGSGRETLVLPIIRETLPNGASYDTIDMGERPSVDEYGPYKVPADHLFLMGDNRDGSADSRVPVGELGLGGAVPFDVIAGRAEIITFSTDGTAKWYNPISWFQALRSGRAGTDLTPERKGS
ncbi:S26 family signal peptidase [Sphingopyxis sp. Root1497]|uniref:signal peptidase I n=1 Tax=Sphingopyxis sp. Root1497 TaxID=1736474 RepID=UPI0006F76325|nr:signal peptidase I [Sphingopyxis sp. Root1497]KQZ62627.1 S26 family signal peptidase [Sphingopyxis sp. Root1497]